MILILSRGHFCPKEHQQHLELAAFYPKIAVAYTKIVTITTDNILEGGEFEDSVGARWPAASTEDLAPLPLRHCGQPVRPGSAWVRMPRTG
jgi:hypothetical protein